MPGIFKHFRICERCGLHGRFEGPYNRRSIEVGSRSDGHILLLNHSLNGAVSDNDLPALSSAISASALVDRREDIEFGLAHFLVFWNELSDRIKGPPDPSRFHEIRLMIEHLSAAEARESPKDPAANVSRGFLLN